MTKSTKKQPTQSGTNWTLIGSIIGGGAILLIGLLIWSSFRNQEAPLTVGEIDATRSAEAEAAAAAASAQSTSAFSQLTSYCDSNPDRCIVEGNDDAANVVFEISDYSCPHCKTFADNQYPLIHDDLIETGEVKYIVIPAPVLGRTPNTPLSVNATLCAIEQDQGGDYHIGVYGLPRSGREATERDLLGLGESLGLDMDAFSSCVESEAHAAAALASRAVVFEAGINSTPTLLLNGRKVDASAQALKAAIQANQ